MEIKSIREFEVDFKGVAYVIDFDVYYYVVEEKPSYYYPGAWDLVIDSFQIHSANFYNPDSDMWQTSRMMASEHGRGIFTFLCIRTMTTLLRI